MVNQGEEVVKALLGYLIEHGVAGAPDISVVRPDGRLIGIEVKTPGSSKLNAYQRARADAREKVGVPTFVVTIQRWTDGARETSSLEGLERALLLPQPQKTSVSTKPVGERTLRIRALLREGVLSQTDIARATGVSRQYVQKVARKLQALPVAEIRESIVTVAPVAAPLSVSTRPVASENEP